MWILKRFGIILAFQPLVLGLILLSRDFWVEGGILCGAALFVVLFIESYCTWKTRLPGRRSLSPITRDSLNTFSRAARPTTPRDIDEESTSLVSSGRHTRARGSFASVLEMMSLTLAVMPSSNRTRGAVPLGKEPPSFLQHFVQYLILLARTQRPKRLTTSPLQSEQRGHIRMHPHTCRLFRSQTTRKRCLASCTLRNSWRLLPSSGYRTTSGGSRVPKRTICSGTTICALRWTSGPKRTCFLADPRHHSNRRPGDEVETDPYLQLHGFTSP